MKRKFFEIVYAPEGEPSGGNPSGGSAPQSEGGPTAGQPPVMPDGLPPQYWDDKSGQVKMADFVADYNARVQSATEHQAKLDALPKKADDYTFGDIKLPDDFKLPEGFDKSALKVDKDDPRIPLVREFALKHQLSQDAVDELVALDAKTQIAAFTQADELLQAEMQKLGANGKERVSAMQTFLQTHVPAEYEALRPFISDATAFAGLEKLITKITSSTNVPGAQPPRASQPAALPVEQRWYGQQKAS